MHMGDAVQARRVVGMAIEPIASNSVSGDTEEVDYLVLDGEPIRKELTVMQILPGFCSTIVLDEHDV